MISKLLILVFIIVISESARILVVIPTPSLSHQIVFRPLTQELAKRHKVVVLTTDSAFKENDKPENFTEINVHNVSYSFFRKHFKTFKMGEKSDSKNVFKLSYKFMIEVFETQLQQPKVKALLTNTFDLVIIESWFRPFLVFSAFWKVPVIKISSFYALYNDYSNIGSFENPMFYPYPSRQKLFNLTWLDEIFELQNDYSFYSILNTYEDSENKMLREIFGTRVPPVTVLNNNVDMMFVNELPTWGSNRPVPMSVVNIGGIYQNNKTELPEDLKSYLDASLHGVIYVSFGTHVTPSLLPAERMRVIIDVLSRLPYEVLFRWDLNTMHRKPDNIRIAKWLPQTDILRHPNVKLFITQGGLQSTEEAIRSLTPLLGIPMFMDQWYNSEKYVQHGIGLQLEFESLTEEQLITAINTLLNDDSYRRNMAKLRDLMHDQPTTALERAVWWTEHVLRHGSARHLRARAAGMGWGEYFEIELFLITLAFLISMCTFIYLSSKMLLMIVIKQFR